MIQLVFVAVKVLTFALSRNHHFFVADATWMINAGCGTIGCGTIGYGTTGNLSVVVH
jgi:uncharacterized UBP type Zn finger protein